MTVVDALNALAHGDWDTAARAAERAAGDDRGSYLARALASYLRELPGPGVYEEPSAFETFIDNGANPELYARTINALRAIHSEAQPVSVLDIGCGDGRVTDGVLDAATRRVDLLEPSPALMDAAVARLTRPGLEVVRHATDAAAYFATTSAGRDTGLQWDVVQSTFALHATRPDDRPAIFGAIARRARRLLVVEFDVPAFPDRSEAHIAHLAERYERGVREYESHPAAISHFLLPVLVGQIDPSRPRFTFEQPIAQWVQLIEHAGFAVRTEAVFRYWWADAVLIDARPV